MIDPIDGIILVDKSEGETSHDVVQKVKRALRVKRTGHAGTLDPFATGLLVILIGRGTKLSPFMTTTKKVYQGTMKLGVQTDTLDPTGRVVKEREVPNIDLEFVRQKAGAFVGEIKQTPPDFSAVKYNGKRAYKLARKGQPFTLKQRKTVVSSFEILYVDLPEVSFKVECAAGTYIRSLAKDLGDALGTVGHLRSLRRIASGSFHVKDAVDSKEISKKACGGFLRDDIISLRDALTGMTEISVDDEIAEKLRRGYQPALFDIANDLDLTDRGETYFKIVSTDELVAVVKVNDNRRIGHESLEIARVFV